MLTSVTSAINHSTLEWYVGLTVRHTTPDIRCRHRSYDYDSEINNSCSELYHLHHHIGYIRYFITDIKTSSSTQLWLLSATNNLLPLTVWQPCTCNRLKLRQTKYTTGTVWAKCRGLALGDFGRDPRHRFWKKRKNCSQNFQVLRLHNSTMITDRRKFTAKLSLYGMSSFLFYR